LIHKTDNNQSPAKIVNQKQKTVENITVNHQQKQLIKNKKTVENITINQLQPQPKAFHGPPLYSCLFFLVLSLFLNLRRILQTRNRIEG